MVLYSIFIILHYDYRRGGSQGGPAGQDPERKAVQRQTPRLVLWFIFNELIIHVNILQAQICINMVLYSIIL